MPATSEETRSRHTRPDAGRQRGNARPGRTEGPAQDASASDLQAMRSLANVAAQTVIMEFESKKHAKLAMDKLLVSLVSLPCGLLLLYWYSVHKAGLTYIAASIAFFAVALWGCQAVKLLTKGLAARLSLAKSRRERNA